MLLDHESTQMTAHYARITDQTVRRRWEQATKVNVNGERVSIDPDGPLAQAQWAKTRYGLATQTLPHGYCGLPVQKSCPHANACLTCPVFLTGPEFLPELREHRGRTLTLIQDAQATGHTRVVEMNTQVLTNLDRMIGEIEHDQDRTRAMPADNSHHLRAAAQRRTEQTRQPRRAPRCAASTHAGAPVTLDGLAREAGVSRSWLYTQPDLRLDIDAVAAATAPPTPRPPSGNAPATPRCCDASTPPPSASAASKHDNQQLRDALARALGERRTARVTGQNPHRDTPGRQSAETRRPTLTTTMSADASTTLSTTQTS